MQNTPNIEYTIVQQDKNIEILAVVVKLIKTKLNDLIKYQTLVLHYQI